MFENAQKFNFLQLHLAYSIARIASLGDAFSTIYELEANPVGDQPLQQKDKKRRKRKGEEKLKKKTRKA